MDFFGIGIGLRAVAETFFQAGRRTGRTTALLESLKPGDRVVCRNRRELDWLHRLCLEREIEDVEFVVAPVGRPQDIYERLISRGTPQGRLIFDHGWLEEFYRNELAESGKFIDEMQTKFSGYGEAHHRTRLQAEAIAKYGFVQDLGKDRKP